MENGNQTIEQLQDKKIEMMQIKALLIKRRIAELEDNAPNFRPSNLSNYRPTWHRNRRYAWAD